MFNYCILNFDFCFCFWPYFWTELLVHGESFELKAVAIATATNFLIWQENTCSLRTCVYEAMTKLKIQIENLIVNDVC